MLSNDTKATTFAVSDTKLCFPVATLSTQDNHWQNFFDQPEKSNVRIYVNIRKNGTGQEDDYRTSYLVDYKYFNKYYKIIAIDSSKQQAFDADSKGTQQVNFTGNLAQEANANTRMFLIIEEAKETILDFPQGTVKVL